MFNPNTIGLLPLAIYGSHNSILLRPVAQAQAQSEHNLFIFIVLCRYILYSSQTQFVSLTFKFVLHAKTRTSNMYNKFTIDSYEKLLTVV